MPDPGPDLDDGGPSDTIPVIQVRNLVTRFGPQVIHDGLNLDVLRGEILGVVGGSGTGKSVLMREILGLQPFAGGRIEVLGRDVGTGGAVPERQGVLFQDGALFSSLTVAQNIQAPLREHLQLDPHLLAALAGLKLALVGLPANAGPKFPSELSGGMRKRAGLARALALDPEVLFLDEPTAGLDPIGAADFDQLILDLNRSLGLTVVMITHDLDSLITICDRIAALIDKRAVVGTLETLYNLDHPWLQAYFQGPRGRAAIRTSASGRG